MKHLGIWLLLSFLFISAWQANLEDNSILDELTKETVEELTHDYTLQTFQSCSAMEEVVEEYIKAYWKYNKRTPFPVFRSLAPGIVEDGVQIEADVSESAALKQSSDTVAVGDFSETNIQVQGVDEADVIKTDGTYIYYYNQSNTAIYIVHAANREVLKKINLPKNFWNPVLYIDDDRLIIVASGSSTTDYSSRGYFINRNSKTYTIVFDTADKSNPELLKLYSSDGNMTNSRRIGDKLYVLSNNYFNFPYWQYKDIDDIDIDVESILPKKLDISKTDSDSDQNLTLKWKSLPYNIQSWDIADCNSIEYSLPDKDTLEESDFNPGYNIVSIIDIRDTTTPAETKVIAGSNSNVYMSLDNLYLTEWIYQQNNFTCPPNALCAVWSFWGGTQNTLIHKLSIDGSDLTYQQTWIVPWSPLNQYSMDEYDDHFRIITSQWRPERSTWVYIFDENLELASSLTELAPGETFQSSRFIGDKLYLVTFEQIDPLFAIDLSDQTDPQILGELKIPWFSTYLHPYDETHIIWLGYDTEINKWWGTSRKWLKVDLYKMHFDKKCGDEWLTQQQEEKCESWDHKWIIVEQKYTQTFGGQGSYSEVLNNPRSFVWNDQKKTLLLPATLQERWEDFQNTDFFNGLLSISIDADSGISLEAQETHIDLQALEADRKQECSKYSQSPKEPKCRELIDGTLYCGDTQNQVRVPNYCFADVPVGSYLASRSWKYNKNFIKRALYAGDSVFAVSDSMITDHDFETLDQNGVVEFR